MPTPCLGKRPKRPKPKGPGRPWGQKPLAHGRTVAGTSNTDFGAAKYAFGGMYFAFFTVNTAKYSPKYFRICKYGPYLAFLHGGDVETKHLRLLQPVDSTAPQAVHLISELRELG